MEGMPLFSRLPSACVNRKAMRWDTGKWVGKGRNHVHHIYQWIYINGKKFTEEQDRSLFLGVERVAGECPEHPRKALIGLSAVSAC